MDDKLNHMFYKAVLENLHGDIAILDKNFRYLYINPYAVKNVEMREWIIGKTDIEYCIFKGLDESIGANRQRKFEEAVISKGEVTWEEAHFDNEGNEKYYLRRVSPVFCEETQELLYLIGHGIEITARQNIRRQLEENKRITDAIINESPNSIFIKNAVGQFVMVNKAVANLYDTTPENLIDKSNAEIHSNSVEASRYLEADADVIKTRKLKRVEETFTKKDGTVFWFDTVKVPIVGEDGSVNVLGISTDITERKKSEDQLRESERQLIEAQQLTKSGSWYLHLKDYSMDWSIGMYAICGIEKSGERLHFDSILKFTHPDDQEVVKEHLNLIVKVRNEDLCEFRLVVNNLIKHVKCFNRAILDSDGKVIAIFGSLIDITDQVLAQEEIILNEMRLNEAQELSKTGSFEYNMETHEIFWSHGMYLIFELDHKVNVSWELFNQHLYPEDRIKIEELNKNLVLGSDPWSYTFRLISATGKLKHIEVFNKFSNSALTGAVTIVGSYVDITERMEIEEKLRLNDARLNEAQELAKIGNFELDLSTNEVFYSKSAYQIYEWDEMDPMPDALKFEEMIHPGDRDYFVELWKLLPERKETFDAYFRIITKSGKLKHIHTINKLGRNSNGELNRIVGIVLDVTERKLADALILKNEQRLVEAQQLSKTGSFELNWMTGVLTWSLGMYAIWELDEAIVPSIDLFYSYVHPDDLPSLKEHEKSIHLEMDPWFHKYRIITPSGKIKHVDTFLKIVKSLSDDSILIVGSCIDVTAAKESEEKLKLNEARLLEAQELSKSGSWEVTLSPELHIDWSPGTYAIWDMEQGVDIPTQENFFTHVHKDDQEKVRSVFKSLIETGAPAEVQFRVTTWANRSKVFYSKGKAIKDENGKVVKIFGTNTDVTERQNAEEKIKFSENSLLQAQRIAKLGSFYFDIVDKTFDWAEGVYYIWERDPSSTEPNFEEVVETVHAEDKTNFIDVFEMTATSGHKQMLEFRIQVGQKKVKFIEARLRVSDYDNGTARKIFGTVVDITERKTVEQELIKSRKIAEESSKAKELFLANISHELRTPLNGILGMSRLLKKSSLSSVQRNYTDVLHQTAENLLVIISEILDFTRIEEGKLTLEEVNFDPTRVADTAINLQMFKAEEKDIALRHKHLGIIPIPKVMGDPYRLSQVLLNLLNNAIKFTNYGEVLLTHEVITEDSEHVEIQFSVQDTGIGIPLAHQSKIFESFTQIDSAGNKQSGVGLGLTISRNLIEKQGGKIWVESKENVGSSFHFIIQYKKAKSNVEPSRMSAIELQDLGTLNILLAEDNKVNVFITESMLTDWGFHVDVAGNGEEVLRLMETNNYDLVLMDIQMPILDGLETTKKIREMRDPAKSRVPVIALTANTGRQAHKQLMSLGMNDWVVKPFKEETLYRKLAMHIIGKDWISESMKKRKFPIRKKPNVLTNELLYDLSSLKSDHPSNKAFLIKMLSIFIETIPVSVENMMMFFEKNQFDQVSKVAHKIKPSIEGAGILVLKECIRNVEDFREKKRNVLQLKTDLELIQKVIGEVIVAFKMEIDKLKEGED